MPECVQKRVSVCTCVPVSLCACVHALCMHVCVCVYALCMPYVYMLVCLCVCMPECACVHVCSSVALHWPLLQPTGPCAVSMGLWWCWIKLR